MDYEVVIENNHSVNIESAANVLNGFDGFFVKNEESLPRVGDFMEFYFGGKIYEEVGEKVANENSGVHVVTKVERRMFLVDRIKDTNDFEARLSDDLDDRLHKVYIKRLER